MMRFFGRITCGDEMHADRSAVLRAIGVLSLTVGIGALLLGPVELYCFYLFTEGGRFHYPGFGFGSFMFANIATQIIGYYLIAAICIPLGYAHLRLRRWARSLALTLLWAWLVVGVPLAIVFLFVLFSSKELSYVVAAVALGLVALSYPVIPALAIWFYHSRPVRETLEAADPQTWWLDRLPTPIRVLAFLYTLYAIILHLPILLNGVFPLYGRWLTGLPGIVALDGAIAVMALLAWGTLRRQRWAWWAGLASISTLATSAVHTLATSSYGEILSAMAFPAREMEALRGIPARGVYLAAFVGLPLVLTQAAILVARRHFWAVGAE